LCIINDNDDSVEVASMPAPMIVASQQVQSETPSKASLFQRILLPSILIFGSIASIAWTALLTYCAIKVVTAL
jgi:hypothetical protein